MLSSFSVFTRSKIDINWSCFKIYSAFIVPNFLNGGCKEAAREKEEPLKEIFEELYDFARLAT